MISPASSRILNHRYDAIGFQAANSWRVRRNNIRSTEYWADVGLCGQWYVWLLVGQKHAFALVVGVNSGQELNQIVHDKYNSTSYLPLHRVSCYESLYEVNYWTCMFVAFSPPDGVG